MRKPRQGAKKLMPFDATRRPSRPYASGLSLTFFILLFKTLETLLFMFFI
jgi:uncharacterized membrane protein YecN with MAPEG domain